MTTEPSAIGRYAIEGVLGRGGFATVYRAREPQLDRPVALKLLMPHLAADAAVRRRFLSEARAIARLAHPNIVTVFEAGEIDNQPYYTMALVEGTTLGDVLAPPRQLSLREVTELLLPLCAAVDYLHEAGIVHRDIKPANVMRSRSGHVLLMDFGIARMLEETKFTESGVTLGTPAYMAPEQVLGHEVGPAADLYSLGVLAFQMLAGRPPFVGATAQILHSQAYEPPPDLSVLRPGLPPQTYTAVSAALAKDPAARPGSASDWAEQLTAGAASMPATEQLTATMPAALAPAIEESVQGDGQPLAEIAELPIAGATLPPTMRGEDEAPSIAAVPVSATLADAAVVPPISADQPTGVLAEADPAPVVSPVTATLPPAGAAPPLVGASAPGPPRSQGGRRGGLWRRPALPIALAAAAALVLLTVAGVVVYAERGGSSHPAASVSAPAQAAAIVQSFTDYAFSQPAVRVVAGTPVRITFRNPSSHIHSWHVLNARDAAGNDIQSVHLNPGTETTLTFTPSARGTYRVQCDIYPAAMQGTFTVD